MKVLITGASGRVGTAVRPHLRKEFRLRLFDVREPAEPPRQGETFVRGDLTSPADVAAALDGIDAVLHLACVHGLDLTFEDSLDVNYRAILLLLQESLKAGVERFIYASSHHVLGALKRSDLPGSRIDPAPDAFYGLGKSFGEAACSLYSARFGLPVFIVRIGNADPTVSDDRVLRLWTSSRDLASLFRLGLKLPGLTQETVYGVSDCPEPLFDNSRAYELGYRPLDRAHDNLSPDFLGYGEMPAELGRDWVGGAYAAAPLPAVEGRTCRSNQ